MVRIMNKTEFIKALKERTKLSLADAEIVNGILESNFFISKKNKDKMIAEIVTKLDISLLDATNIYDSAKEIINEEVKNKLKHPFRNKD